MDGAERAPRSRLRRLLAEPWAIALLYAVIAVLLAVLGFDGLWRDISLIPDLRESSWLALATALPAAATVLLRRRAPGLGLALAIPLFLADILTVGGIVPMLVVLEHVHALTVRLRPRQRQTVLVWGMASVAAAMLTLLAVTGDLRLASMIGLQLGALIGMTFWYANSVAQSRELVALYRRQAEDAERLAELDRASAVQEERERLASELHDIVAGHVSAVAIRSEAALLLQDDGGAATESGERAALRAVRDSSLQAHEALRTMVSVLRDGSAVGTTPPGRAQLPALVSEARRTGLDVQLRDAWVGELPPVVDQTIGRVVQESLANSAKHDFGAHVEVTIAGQSQQNVNGMGILVSVESRGGRALAQPGLRGSGIGLPGLAERVRALGGEFSAGPHDGGWLVTAQLPGTEDRA
ncbi:putative two-component system sensor kinase [Leucobacter sp. 7(1)]|uniref:sensor histidine kinase n=1 Tax=Leucobacter sp. 7(1) TaxID=1255613 RepID=UPI00097EB869|nr:histidine kinase [Leucobacter sp. 7(1)]SJN12653.1 putative two-component system sensor kinase [Leucobacter sp. 7(1)]